MNNHSIEINKAKKRLVISCVLALSVFGGIFSQLVSISWISKNISASAQHNSVSETRNNILDRNGNILATSVKAWKIIVNPREVLDPELSAKKLNQIMPEKNYDWIYNKLTSKSGYQEIDRKASPLRYKKILNAGITGIKFKENETRFYPTQKSLSHIIGNVGRDNVGLSGIELSQDNELRFGYSDIKLTIDLGVQYIVENELQRQIDKFDAIGGAAILINVKNGEIISAASNPSFDLNNNILIDNERFNRYSVGTYEMGSTFKLINSAIAIDSKKVSLNDKFEINTPLRRGKYTINDFETIKKFDKPVNLSQILIHSSNIGSALIAEKIGSKTQKSYMEKLGLTSKLNIPFPEVAKPQVSPNWDNLRTMTIGFGHGISVTPLQLTYAIAAIMNGGNYIKPKLLIDNEPIISKRVFQSETSNIMRKLARIVVTQGSGKNADAKGYLVGGKTGTAEKVISGHYNKKKNLASFVGIFPIHDPDYLVFVMIDEPKGQSFSNNFTTGGWVAAPVVKRIINKSAPILRIKPFDQNLPEIKHILDFNLKKYFIEARI